MSHEFIERFAKKAFEPARARGDNDALGHQGSGDHASDDEHLVQRFARIPSKRKNINPYEVGQRENGKEDQIKAKHSESGIKTQSKREVAIIAH